MNFFDAFFRNALPEFGRPVWLVLPPGQQRRRLFANITFETAGQLDVGQEMAPVPSEAGRTFAMLDAAQSGHNSIDGTVTCLNNCMHQILEYRLTEKCPGARVELRKRTSRRSRPFAQANSLSLYLSVDWGALVQGRR